MAHLLDALAAQAFPRAFVKAVPGAVLVMIPISDSPEAAEIPLLSIEHPHAEAGVRAALEAIVRAQGGPITYSMMSPTDIWLQRGGEQRQLDELVESVRRVFPGEGGTIIAEDEPTVGGGRRYAIHAEPEVPYEEVRHGRLLLAVGAHPRALAGLTGALDLMGEPDEEGDGSDGRSARPRSLRACWSLLAMMDTEVRGAQADLQEARHAMRALRAHVRAARERVGKAIETKAPVEMVRAALRDVMRALDIAGKE